MVLNIMKKISIFIIILSVSAVALSAVRLPEGYKTLGWGAPQDNAIVVIDSFPVSSCITPDQRISSIFAILYDDPQRANVTLLFYYNKLFTVTSDLKAPAVDVIKDLRGKYGDPIMERALIEENGIKSKRTVWQDNTSCLAVEEYSNSTRLTSYAKAYLPKKGSTQVHILQSITTIEGK